MKLSLPGIPANKFIKKIYSWSILLLVTTYWATAQATAPGTVVKEESSYQLNTLYVVAVYVPMPVRTYDPPTWTHCSCVEFVKQFLGIKNEVWGWAGNIIPNSQDPIIGSVVLTTEGGGHAAVITDIHNNILYIKEANYKPCQVTERQIPVGDKKIRGYKNDQM